MNTSPYVVVNDDRTLSVRMRPDDTQGNFVVSNWEAVKVGGQVLIQGETWKAPRHSFTLTLPFVIIDERGKALDISRLLETPSEI